ncbi:hypothetical protein QBC41DRAFT_24958 [Cercophora samala]|uniref:Uncharacterized protein n=1 Tax=Cercophora samala TaxID=330535 RepID=A0AA40DEW0_9PEZI|nr:hypothetical protein QBC41DRAFT_24958 [Cercophora samala]
MNSTTDATITQEASRRGPTIRVRKYGHNDFERFDEEIARGSHLCVGSASIGKVDIDCKYHWKKAQWGVLGAVERPAGIVYMDITFKQPQGYWLQSANVFVTLSQDTTTNHRRQNKLPPRPLGSDYSVQITQQFGPKYLTGTPTVQAEAKSNSFIPTFGAMGFEIGGVGHQSITSKNRVGQWVFKGTVGRPKAPRDYCTLEWELIENELDPNKVHKQEYNTAFAFEHSEKPVIMRVDVQGKLQSKTRQLKHDFLKFSTQFGKSDNSTLTHLDLSKTTGLKKVLDPIADGLDMAMQMENCGNPGTVVPDPAPAQFHSLNWQSSNHNSHGLQNAQIQSQTKPQQQIQDNGQEYHRNGPRLIKPKEPQPQLLNNSYDEGSVKPIMQSLRRRQARTTQQVPVRVNLEESAMLVGEEDSGYGTQVPEDERSEHIIQTIPSTSHRIPPASQIEALEENIKEITWIPGILLLINFLVTITRWLSAMSKPPLADIRRTNRGQAGNKAARISDKSHHGAGSVTSKASDSLVWEGSPSPATKPLKTTAQVEDRGSEGPKHGQRRGPFETTRRHRENEYGSSAHQ